MLVLRPRAWRGSCAESSLASGPSAGPLPQRWRPSTVPRAASRARPGAPRSAWLSTRPGSCGGRPPPLTVGPDGARLLPGGQGERLGRPSRPRFTQGEEALAAGTTVVLGIDGSDMLSRTATVERPAPLATALE